MIDEKTVRHQEFLAGLPDPGEGKMLVVIIPALDEERTIGSVIREIPSDLTGIRETKVVVVDDGSRDRTVQLAQQNNAYVIRHEVNMGVGAAFHTGLREALRLGADIVVNIDGDGQFNPRDIPALIKPILTRRADFVTATRFARKEYRPDMPTLKLYGNQAMTLLINSITRKKFTDVSCGFRAYSREAALRLTLFGRFTYTQESFIDLSFKNMAMTEVPLKIKGIREYGKSKVADNLWRYGLKTATIIFRAARDYRPHYFFGLPGAAIFLAGFASGLFLLRHFILTGQTYPYRSLVQLSGVLIIVGFLLLFLSLLADMLYRNRIIAEEAVYLARKSAYRTREK